MSRELSQFQGDALIIGGGWCDEHKIAKPSVRKPDYFYTIDIDSNAKPDAIVDITDEAQCAALPEKRFGFIYFESFPWLDEASLIKAFKSAHRLLKEDGVLIYRGGSMKSASSIPELLKKAGYLNARKKELDPDEPKSSNDNGSISIASDIDPNLIKENLSKLPEVTRHYLNYYKFFSEEPYSFHGYLKNIKIPSSIFCDPLKISVRRYEVPKINSYFSSRFKMGSPEK